MTNVTQIRMPLCRSSDIDKMPCVFTLKMAGCNIFATAVVPSCSRNDCKAKIVFHLCHGKVKCFIWTAQV